MNAGMRHARVSRMDATSTTDRGITVPPSTEIAARLASLRDEERALIRLLRLARAAERARDAARAPRESEVQHAR